MRGQSPLLKTLRAGRPRPSAGYVCRQCRAIQISAPAATDSPGTGDGFGAPIDGTRDPADARFEVLGSPYSLLSVSLSASQKLYTRRGTLVSVAGNVENAQSTLSLLSPFRRAFLGIPFLYQRVASTTPITALIGAKSPSTTFHVLHLDGTTDWMVSQRNALLAWTGHTLSVAPRIRRGLSLAHWGSSLLTGRGLVALAAPGHVYQLHLAQGEELVLHPSHVVAYSVNKNPPLPFRLRNSGIRLQVPAVPASLSRLSSDLVPDRLVRFWSVMRETDTYKFLGRLLYGLRTTARRSIWGDRLFLHFRGPATLLMSSRGVRVAEALTREEVNEVADTEAGVVPAAVALATAKEESAGQSETRVAEKAVSVHIATVGQGGKVRFEDSKDLKEFVR